jgi:arabinose-5-phosphate isomerase
LGDAVAMALLERSGLTANDFKTFHPGGKLGARLLTVGQLMHNRDQLPVVQPGTKMSDALVIMAEKNLGGVIVADAQDHVLGLITDGDLKRHMDTHLLERRVETIMTANPKTISPDTLAAEAVDIMMTEFARPITSLLVVDNRKIVGLVQLQSCYAAGVV